MIERDGVRWTIETHAIVSREGFIADADGIMPPCLIVPSDQKRFQAALSRAALTIVGRKGHEAHSANGRRRLVLTSQVSGLSGNENMTFWNPEGAPVEDALSLAAPNGGTVANAGGQRVMSLCLPWTDRFDLVVAEQCMIANGIACLPGTRSVTDILLRLREAGFAETTTVWIDAANGLRLHSFQRER